MSGISGSSFRGYVSETDLRLLRVFKAVADGGGFSAAEVHLGKSKSAISTDITDLERRLGVKLCQRGRSGFLLTAEGEHIRRAVDELVQDLDRFRDKVNRARQHLSGELSIYVTDNIVTHDQSPIVRAITAFARLHPHVFLTLVSAPASDVEQALLDGRANLGISIVARPVPNLDMLPLFEEINHLYCGAEHSLFAVPDEELTFERIADCRMVDVSAAGEAGFVEALRQKFQIAARSNSIDARVILLLSGEFLGFLPPPYARTWVERGQLRALMPSSITTTNVFYAIFNRAAPPSLIVDQFREILLSQYRLPRR
ncbi:MAG: LysR family transcriptional regulator [Parvibaculaceae bacterium]|nr:LysR family transcriptional regulator [Parvibaculaceae bacterium]